MPIPAFAYVQQNKTKWETLEQGEEFVAEYALWMPKKLVPGAGLPMDEPAQNSAAPVDEKNSANDFQTNAAQEKDFSANETGEKQSGEIGANFDALFKKAMKTNVMEDLNAHIGAVFALPEWNFISRGELPNVYPHGASNAAHADNEPMVRAFTDSDRLMRFARENNLTEMDGSRRILTMPTANIVEYLESLIPSGAFGVWFNSDTESEGFFIPIKQLRPIKEHLAKLNLPQQSEPKKSAFETGILIINDGLGFPSGFVSDAKYTLNIFFRVPASWAIGGKLTQEAQERIFRFLYGENWRMGNDDGSFYVVRDSNSNIFDEETVKNTKWEGTTDTDENHYRFYIAGEDGTISSVKEEEFQAHIDKQI